jgi:hypothetical protein
MTENNRNQKLSTGVPRSDISVCSCALGTICLVIALTGLAREWRTKALEPIAISRSDSSAYRDFAHPNVLSANAMLFVAFLGSKLLTIGIGIAALLAIGISIRVGRSIRGTGLAVLGILFAIAAVLLH